VTLIVEWPSAVLTVFRSAPRQQQRDEGVAEVVKADAGQLRSPRNLGEEHPKRIVFPRFAVTLKGDRFA
jgi:hypothetical protein